MLNKRYNAKHKCYITLKEGERFCPKCNGNGYVKGPTRFSLLNCNVCLGDGKLDWIEEATGKKPKFKYVKPGVYIHEIDSGRIKR